MAKQHPYKNKPNPKSEHTAPSFSPMPEAKLGSQKRPLELLVSSEARKHELTELCTAESWAANITVDSNAEENIAELTLLQNKPNTQRVAKQPGRNDPCSCGSGKKFKKCCGLNS